GGVAARHVLVLGDGGFVFAEAGEDLGQLLADGDVVRRDLERGAVLADRALVPALLEVGRRLVLVQPELVAHGRGSIAYPSGAKPVSEGRGLRGWLPHPGSSGPGSGTRGCRGRSSPRPRKWRRARRQSATEWGAGSPRSHRRPARR